MQQLVVRLGLVMGQARHWEIVTAGQPIDRVAIQEMVAVVSVTDLLLFKLLIPALSKRLLRTSTGDSPLSDLTFLRHKRSPSLPNLQRFESRPVLHSGRTAIGSLPLPNTSDEYIDATFDFPSPAALTLKVHGIPYCDHGVILPFRPKQPSTFYFRMYDHPRRLTRQALLRERKCPTNNNDWIRPNRGTLVIRSSHRRLQAGAGWCQR